LIHNPDDGHNSKLQILIQPNIRLDSAATRLLKSSTTNQFTAKARKGF